MICVLDFETSELPPRGTKVNSKTYTLFPRAIQICCIMYDEKSNEELYRKSMIFKIDDFVIPEGSIKVHGITDEISQESGVYFGDVYSEFLETLGSASLVIGHNISFDLDVFRTEMYHLFHDNMQMLNETVGQIDRLKTFCTMKKSTKLCNIRELCKSGNYYRVKWPKLVELHQKLFDEDPSGNLHNADTDCEICYKCFVKLKEVLAAH